MWRTPDYCNAEILRLLANIIYLLFQTAISCPRPQEVQVEDAII
jgi:hypothetical protein